MRRRISKRGVTVTCRKGTLGFGADIARKLIDVSEEGAKLIVKVALGIGEEIEIGLTPPGMSKPVVRIAEVVRCESSEGDGYSLAVRFRAILNYSDLYHLV